jgi:hypothetical protein
MASRSVCSDLPNQLTTLFRFGVVGDLSDRQLLQRFLAERNGADHAAAAWGRRAVVGWGDAWSRG